MKPEQAEALRKPFPASAIGRMPKGGVYLDYVGHAATTDRLLAVDPAWTWEPVAFGEDGLPRLDENGGLWIRLTVADVTRYGYGDASGKKGPNAVKEAIGDAIRNAAMRFGVALDLWAKEDISATTPEPAPAKPHATDTQVLGWDVAIEQAANVEELNRLAHELAAYDLGEARADLTTAWTARKAVLDDPA